MNESLPPPAAPVRRLDSTVASAMPTRDAALDLVRTTLTLLVIAHHAVLAYHLYAPPAGAFTRENMIWAAFPIVDAARGPVIDAFTLWNDSFFMAMLFLLAGLFVPGSLERKGVGRFLRDRALRLGVPFVIGAAVLAPLAYYPAYLLRAEATPAGGFWAAWGALDVWPAGPMWFLWVLLAFSAMAAGLHAWAPRGWAMLAKWGEWCRQGGAVRACVVLGAATMLVYWVTTRWVSSMTWSTWGPFAVQTSRVGLYALYFLFGCALGSGRGISAAWMTADGALARRWPAWQGVAGGVFGGFVAALIMLMVNLGKGQPMGWLEPVVTLLFAATGVVTTFMLLATFARWGHGERPWMRSLTRNAFGMYLVHYAVVTWTQWLLLDVAWPGLAKAVAATVLSIGASWVIAAGLRRVPGVARVL